MSGPSDKARFYLEQAVPQLQEFKEKKIFSEVGFYPVLKINGWTRHAQSHSTSLCLKRLILPVDSVMALILVGGDSNIGQKAI
jgi:hypothetical protein